MPAEYFVQNSITKSSRGHLFYSKVTGHIVFYAVLLIIVTAGLFQAADYLLYRLAYTKLPYKASCPFRGRRLYTVQLSLLRQQALTQAKLSSLTQQANMPLPQGSRLHKDPAVSPGQEAAHTETQLALQGKRLHTSQAVFPM